MKKITRFKDIPQFTQDGSWQADFSFEYLVKHINEEIEEQGLQLNPDFQRGHVWTQEDKELLLDSIFKNIDIGKFVFIKLSDSEWTERNVAYEILDGKQRLSTLIEFYENKLTYKGKYFNDLSDKDNSAFMSHMVSVAEVDESDKKTILKQFLMLNRTGKVMDDSHLKAVENMLAKMESGIKEDVEEDLDLIMKSGDLAAHS